MFRHKIFQTQQVRRGAIPMREVLKPIVIDGRRVFESVSQIDVEEFPSMLDYSLENLLAAGIPLQEIPLDTLDMNSMYGAINSISEQIKD